MAAELTNNLVSTLEKIKNKRYTLIGKMEEDEQLKSQTLAKIEMRSSRLAKVLERKAKRITAKKEYEKVIMETEAAYKKILEGSALLLKKLQDDAVEEEKAAAKAAAAANPNGVAPEQGNAAMEVQAPNMDAILAEAGVKSVNMKMPF